MTGKPPNGDGGVRETHISVLLFLEERVVKIRKPLRLDFVDFSSFDARAKDCRREVDLNRRLSPDVYLGVGEITMDGEVLEHCVVMRRLPAERSLARRVREKQVKVWQDDLRAVAQTLGDFHSQADRSAEISRAATVEAIGRQFDANVEAMERFGRESLDPVRHQAVVEGVRHFLQVRAPIFSGRIDGGYICDGHGDLQAGDIYCMDDGPRILDCLEFNDELRYGDIAADVAFLIMDLERLGFRPAAVEFLRCYEEVARAHVPRSLLHFYIALRAYVRCKVACLRHEQGDPEAGGEAARLVALAQSHLESARIRLVLVGGLPGSGKSTLATALGDVIGAPVLRSDEFRRRLDGTAVGSAASDVFGGGRYTPDRAQSVYDALLETARTSLQRGDSVIVDASWIDATHRDQARRLAKETAVDVFEMHCTAPAEVTEGRIEGRRRKGSDPSEATVEVARAMREIEQPWPSAVSVDTDRPLEHVLAKVLGLMGLPGRT
ncbi:MAG TPA: AAA family ATPase [Acidimicrobiales bacterium]|nr:AAA family ATPase [Acidimicrobiales bacterium]